MKLHIYTAALQPYTKYMDHTFDPPLECSTPGGRLVYCECCNKRRFARDVVVQCFYDGRRLSCAPGRGCNNPRLLEAARRREHKMKQWNSRETLPKDGTRIRILWSNGKEDVGCFERLDYSKWWVEEFTKIEQPEIYAEGGEWCTDYGEGNNSEFHPVGWLPLTANT